MAEALRGATVVLLLLGAPLRAGRRVVLVTNVFGWVGYAGMRAEVARGGRGRRR